MKFIVKKQIYFCKIWYHTYENSLENHNKIIDKFTKHFAVNIRNKRQSIIYLHIEY